MMRRLPLPLGSLIAAAVALAAAAGCRDTVYFYETDKASLSMEVRPDPTAPVSGNFGLKQRIVAVVPATRPSTEETRPKGPPTEAELADLAAVGDAAKQIQEIREKATTRPAEEAKRLRSEALGKTREINDRLARGNRGDAMSVISSFRFHKYPAQRGAINHRITIDAALITGGAAHDVAAAGTVNRAIGALSGASPAGAEVSGITVMSHVHNGLKKLAEESPTSPAAERLAALDALAADLPPAYPVAVYEQAEPGKLRVARARGEPVIPPGQAERPSFLDVIAYGEGLRDSAAELRRAADLLRQEKPLTIETDAGATTFDGKKDSPQTQLAIDGLLLQARETDAALEDYRRRFVAHPALRAAARTFLGL